MADNLRTADARAVEEVVALRIGRGFFDDASMVEEEKRQALLVRIAITQFASKSTLFESVAAEVVPLITSRGVVEHFKVGELIIQQNEPDQDFYLLIRGAVEVFIGDKTLSQIDEGGFFGEVALIANSPRTASVRAKTEVQVLKLAPTQFWEVLTNYVSLGLYIETVAKVRAETLVDSLQLQEV